jgi:hypothetical protein
VSLHTGVRVALALAAIAACSRSRVYGHGGLSMRLALRSDSPNISATSRIILNARLVHSMEWPMANRSLLPFPPIEGSL